MKFGRFCKCGHPKEKHFIWNPLVKGSTDDRGTCLHGAVVIGAWTYHACECPKYTPKNWPLIHFYED